MKSSPYLSVFSLSQLQALALMFLNLNTQTYSIGVIFEGLFWIPTGYLIFQSTFLPRLLGVPFVLGGLGWLTFLWPALNAVVLPYIGVFGTLAEAALMLWLLVKGVNAQRWQAQARAAVATIQEGQPG